MITLWDTETTGFKAKDGDKVIEIGAQVCDYKFNVLKEFQTFIKRSEPLTQEIKDITHITDEDLAGGMDAMSAWQSFGVFCEGSTHIFAHNAPFDRGFLDEAVKSDDAGLTRASQLLNIPHVDTKMDLKRVANAKCRRLQHIALDFGIAVDPSKQHRALADVELMRQVILRCGQTFEEIIAYMNDEVVTTAIVIPKPWTDGGEGNARAKELGFRYEKLGDKTFPKTWVKAVKRSELDDLKKNCKYLLVEV